MHTLKRDRPAEFLKYAALAREQAEEALSPVMRERFITIAAEWERLAKRERSASSAG